MSTPHEPQPAKLFVSILFGGSSEPADTPESSAALAALEHEYGPVDFLSPVWRFDYTPYYHREMGASLWRRACSFERLVPRGQLVDIKHFCLQREQQYRDKHGNRRVNLDPGLLSKENLILATGKNMTHRVYLDRGIFADLTLIYHSHRFQKLLWTYPDYAADEMTDLLMQMRDKLLEQLNTRSTSTGG
jgi:hypothetical protein